MYKHLPDFGISNKILLVEDDPSYVRLVEIMLEQSDLGECEITNVSTLADGLKALKEGNYAAILLDLNLPDSTGFETLETFLTHYPNNNIIVLTGASDKYLGLKAVKAGAQDYLEKGEFDFPQLAKSLRFSIERSNILSRLEDAQRIAKIGHWECRLNKEFFFASNEVYRIFNLDPVEAKFVYADLKNPENPLHVLIQMEEEAKLLGISKREERIVIRNGSTRFISLTCKATRNSLGHYHFNGILQDITEQKRAEEMRNARDLAQESAKIKEQVIANVSHEMRTPMNAILGMTNLLLPMVKEKEEYEYVYSIKQSSEVLLGIINDILHVSAYQNNEIHFSSNAFNLTTVMQDLMEAMRPKAQEKKLDFDLFLPSGLHQQIIGDKLRLNQILYNLVGNAIKFTDKGGVKVKIEILRQTIDFLELRFSIKDSGIGIPDSELESIFETFTRISRKDRVTEGTGLGLAITKKIIEQQGGKIQVVSQLGSGSVFYFDLMFELAPETQLKNKPYKENNSAKDSSTLSFSVLIVEDHKMNQLVIQRTLEKHWKNVKVIVTSNGDEAIEVLEKQSVDIILMDLQMPIRDGFETTNYIRKNMPVQIAQTPILAMTAHHMISQQEKFSRYGLDDYVLKPFDPEQLFEKIEFHLARKALKNA
ncbi:MAG: hypothetical protein DHS20C18_01470 [Saprospiraceae bacterium]|nr:MAG: hypothetical protein DHS20C18_01470 [Saprospiraceae bacterium]